MALSNPAFSRNPAFKPNNPVDGANVAATATETNALATAEGIQSLYEAPAATSSDTGRMTYEDTVVKTVLLFAVILATAVVGWFFPVLTFPGAIVGFVLGLVNSFKRKPSPALILLYGAAQGLFIGGISALFENLWQGVVIQAVLATLAVFAVTLILFANGKVRASARATKVFLVALIGYALFGIVNLVVMMFGGFSSATTGGPFGIYSMHIPWLFNIPLGVIIGVLAVIMAAYSLVLDFDFIQNGVKNRAPRVMGWYGAFGLAVTLIWLYVEFLRLFAIIAGGSRN
ncbi:Bax inhibitor-1/YccA family protein [Humibacter ginsenosidimutans]|uniref:Bax inhibitor-1/YccA family protein n=1 Tax=Humibacter ginsenosidimutans TaxID=2599293 RepID=A0A5B8M5Y8_9MICO|nr:Bax inhibitor-1/YccA family protein [Humibacter ginsenosidimutans]QDZ14890.1 Bax inhibitor-1/YccA family protein [Humibacter ginsenosidimutans]